MFRRTTTSKKRDNIMKSNSTNIMFCIQFVSRFSFLYISHLSNSIFKIMCHLYHITCVCVHVYFKLFFCNAIVLDLLFIIGKSKNRLYLCIDYPKIDSFAFITAMPQVLQYIYRKRNFRETNVSATFQFLNSLVKHG